MVSGKDATTYLTSSITIASNSSKHEQTSSIPIEPLTSEALGASAATIVTAILISSGEHGGAATSMSVSASIAGFIAGNSSIFTFVPPTNPGGPLSPAPTSIPSPSNPGGPMSPVPTTIPPPSNPGGPLSPVPTSVQLPGSPAVLLFTTVPPPSNPGGPLSLLPITATPPTNPGGPLSPATTATTPTANPGGPLSPIPRILPVYSPELLGNAYGGGFVVTPSVYAEIFAESTGSAQGVPPGYGYSLQAGQTVVGNSIVEVSTTMSPKDTIMPMSTTSAKDKTGSPDSIPTSIASGGIPIPMSNYTVSTPTVQPFEGIAGKSSIGEAVALLGFLALFCFA